MRNQLHAEYEQAAAEAASLYGRIKAQATREDRPFTASECHSLESSIERANALKKRLGETRSDAAMQTEIARLTAGMTGDGRVGGRSVGAQFANSAAGEWLRTNKIRGSHWETPMIELADPRGFATMHATTITENPAGGGVAVPPMYLPGIVPVPLRPPVVADLLSNGPTTSNAITYLKETAYTNAAAAVAEGAAKPEAAITFQQVSDPVQKIASWLPVTDELLEDVPAMGTYLDTRLMQGVQVTEEDQLLNGSGVAPNILGLLARTGLAPDVARVDPQVNADAIATQMAAIMTATNLEPTGTIIHPSNWLTILLQKDSTGRYIGASPFMPPGVPSLWGKPVAISKATTAGVAVVVCREAATVFRRGGIAVQASNSHQDFFIKNLTAIRAEERIALCVFRAAAFGKVTGLA
jgi:HK97 family phage major capsid protein